MDSVEVTQEVKFKVAIVDNKIKLSAVVDLESIILGYADKSKTPIDNIAANSALGLTRGVRIEKEVGLDLIKDN